MSERTSVNDTPRTDPPRDRRDADRRGTGLLGALWQARARPDAAPDVVARSPPAPRCGDRRARRSGGGNACRPAREVLRMRGVSSGPAPRRGDHPGVPSAARMQAAQRPVPAARREDRQCPASGSRARVPAQLLSRRSAAAEPRMRATRRRRVASALAGAFLVKAADAQAAAPAGEMRALVGPLGLGEPRALVPVVSARGHGAAPDRATASATRLRRGRPIRELTTTKEIREELERLKDQAVINPDEGQRPHLPRRAAVRHGEGQHLRRRGATRRLGDGRARLLAPPADERARDRRLQGRSAARRATRRSRGSRRRTACSSSSAATARTATSSPRS